MQLQRPKQVPTLQGADLSHSTLTGANLTGANLAHANLTADNFSPAATWTDADLRGADLQYASLTDVGPLICQYRFSPTGSVISAGPIYRFHQASSGNLNAQTVQRRIFAYTASYAD